MAKHDQSKVPMREEKAGFRTTVDPDLKKRFFHKCLDFGCGANYATERLWELWLADKVKIPPPEK